MCLQTDPDTDFESQSDKSYGQISTVQHLNVFVEGDMIWIVWKRDPGMDFWSQCTKYVGQVSNVQYQNMLVSIVDEDMLFE